MKKTVVLKSVAMCLFLIIFSSSISVSAFYSAKFEPADGSIYSGAGQSIESIVQMTNTGKPNRKPMLVAAYDFLNPAVVKDVNVYVPQYDIIEAHNLYPGSKLQIGMELPKDNLTELQAIGTGKYDNWIKGMASAYKSLNQDIFLRIGYEFDGAWNKYDPVAYISAYQRIVNIFRNEGVTNVAFVWNSYTPDQDSTNSTDVGYRWNGSKMLAWYPGDNYVDWFSFNEWRKNFDASWYMNQAAAHNKPVFVGEGSYTKHLDSGYSFDQWVGPHFTSIKNSGAKGFQYINWNWPIYPISDWSNWADGKYTKNASYVSVYNAEMQNSKYIVRDDTYYNPMALWVGASRSVTSLVNGAIWKKADDEYSMQSGYDYQPITAFSNYGDGWGAHWGNQSNTSEFTTNITVPVNSSGYIILGGFASYLGHDVYVGARKVFSGIKPTAPVKFKYLASDIVNGNVAVKIVESDTSAIRVTAIGVQTISPSAPTAPTGLVVGSASPTTISLSWSSVTGSPLYNIYRNGQLIGTSISNSYTDTNLPFGKAYQYSVSAWHNKNGEGNMSNTITARTSGVSTDPLNDFSLVDYHTAKIVLDGTNQGSFGGDIGRVTRTDRTDEYITYNVNGMTSASFDLYYTNNMNNVYVNVTPATNQTWTSLTLSQTAPVMLANGWYKITYSTNIPIGNNYIGIHMTGGTPSTANQQQVGSVTLSNIGSAPTPTPSGDTQSPSVSNLNASTITNSQIKLSWSQSTDNVGVSGYEIHRSSVNGFTVSSSTLINTVSGSTLLYGDTGLTSFTNYYYRVVAYDAAGNKAQSNQASTRTSRN